MGAADRDVKWAVTHRVLRHDANGAPHGLLLHSPDVDAVDENFPLRRVVEAEEETRDRRLPRSRVADKRGGGRRREALTVIDGQATGLGVLDMLALDDALRRLGELDARKARLVELRFFGGLSSEEAASVLEISRSTAVDDWRMARAWLTKELASHG